MCAKVYLERFCHIWMHLFAFVESLLLSVASSLLFHPLVTANKYITNLLSY